MTDTKDLESQIAALPAGDSIERADLLTDLARQVAMGDIPRGMALNDESLAMSKRLSYDRGIRYATYHAGFGEYLKSEHEKAMATLLEAERMMQAGDDVAGLGLVQGIMGNVHLSLGDYERSLDSLFKGLKAHRAVGDDLHEAWLLHGIGGCYHEMGDHARALQYHSEALEQFEVLDLDVGRARALVGIGIVYQAQQDYDKALEHQKRSLAGFRKGENEFGESRALNDMGVTLQAQGDFVTARKHHERALELRKKFGNRQAVSTSLINLGKLLLAEGDVAAARDHVEQALVIAEEIAAKPRIFQSHLALSDIHAALGDPATALKHYKLYEQVKEKVAGDLANSRLINLQVGFEMEKADREAEISRLKNVELKEKNSQLEVLLNELHTTQAQLIQSEKMSALGSLVAGLLHEFNTPLGAITGISDVTDRCVSRIRSLVTESDSELLSNDKFAQALEIMESNQKVTQMATGRIGQITKSLQGFTRLDAASLEPADLNLALEQTLTLLEHNFRGRVEIVREFTEVEPVLADMREMNHVFMTLLQNAGESIAESGQVRVRTADDGDRVRVEISDTGSGMNDETTSQIFEPTFAPTGERIKAGLGLVAAASIVENNGGEIKAESILGEGTTFRIWLRKN